MDPALFLKEPVKPEVAQSLDKLEKETFQFVRSHRRAHVPEKLLHSMEQCGDFDKDELALFYEVGEAEEQQSKQVLAKLRNEAKRLHECLVRRQGFFKLLWDRNFLTKEITEALLQRQFILEKQLKYVESTLAAFPS